KDGGEVDAITAATISSRAFCDAVQVAYDAMKKGGSK
ncbi:MAG TPA: FMN-binding protein, partial [bacterium]|nr:FMN-binding protein [bacterium]